MFYEIYYCVGPIGSGYAVVLHVGKSTFTSDDRYISHEAACRVARKAGAKKLQ